MFPTQVCLTRRSPHGWWRLTIKPKWAHISPFIAPPIRQRRRQIFLPPKKKWHRFDSSYPSGLLSHKFHERLVVEHEFWAVNQYICCTGCAVSSCCRYQCVLRWHAVARPGIVVKFSYKKRLDSQSALWPVHHTSNFLEFGLVWVKCSVDDCTLHDTLLHNMAQYVTFSMARITRINLVFICVSYRTLLLCYSL